MKHLNIVLIEGESGVGKTSIIQELQKQHPTTYHIVESYTDRPMRQIDEVGHTFLNPNEMTDLLKNHMGEVIATTNYGDYRYCSTIKQFEEDKINLYVVDNKGIYDVNTYKEHNTIAKIQLKSIHVTREDISSDVSKERQERTKPEYDVHYDFILNNNTNLEDTVKVLHEYLNKE